MAWSGWELIYFLIRYSDSKSALYQTVEQRVKAMLQQIDVKPSAFPLLCIIIQQYSVVYNISSTFIQLCFVWSSVLHSGWIQTVKYPQVQEFMERVTKFRALWLDVSHQTGTFQPVFMPRANTSIGLFCHLHLKQLIFLCTRRMIFISFLVALRKNKTIETQPGSCFELFSKIKRIEVNSKWSEQVGRAFQNVFLDVFLHLKCVCFFG